jgi:aminoglycoside phosphotransferase (APT) family kinase protein
MTKPAAEVDVDIQLAGKLLCSQHPDMAHLPLAAVGSGWDNCVFRLGDEWALRLPRRGAAAILIENEQRWLPSLRAHLPLEVPAPVRLGVAQYGYPWSWSIVPWIVGETADLTPPDEGQGVVLAAFFQALHRPAPAAAPVNPYRGVPLARRAVHFHERVAELSLKTDVVDRQLLSLWDDALRAPADTAPTWIHGDLHPRNVLIADGRLRGVIDWGDLAQGDRAVDLAAIWMLLPHVRDRERAMAGCNSVSEATWVRARGWALLLAVILLRAGLGNDPPMAAIARSTLERLRIGP